MKFLGIDFGTKRVGLALSDDARKLAFPYSVLANDEKLLKTVITVAKKENVSEVVMGESKNFSGEPNILMKDIDVFKKSLEDSGLRVIFEPEFLSSFQAKRFQGENEMHDASSAAIILQSYLDRF